MTVRHDYSRFEAGSRFSPISSTVGPAGLRTPWAVVPPQPGADVAKWPLAARLIFIVAASVALWTVIGHYLFR